MRVTASTPTAGMVIPANSQHALLRMEGATVVRHFRPELERLDAKLSQPGRRTEQRALVRLAGADR